MDSPQAEATKEDKVRGDIEDTRKRIAYLIRAELVCCDIYHQLTFDRPSDKVYGQRRRQAALDHTWHDICYFGEWSALLAESGDLPEHVYYGPSDEHPDSPVTRSDRPRRTPDPRND